MKHDVEGAEADTADEVHASVVATAATLSTVQEILTQDGYEVDEGVYLPLEGQKSGGSLTALLESHYASIKTEFPAPPNTACEEEQQRRASSLKPRGSLLPKNSQEGLTNFRSGSGIMEESEVKRFIACEEEWFSNTNDFSTLQTLLECPALQGISESGALNITNWVENYLYCSGLTRAAGDSVILGQLRDWNYVEEFVPHQMIQVRGFSTVFLFHVFIIEALFKFCWCS